MCTLWLYIAQNPCGVTVTARWLHSSVCVYRTLKGLCTHTQQWGRVYCDHRYWAVWILVDSAPLGTKMHTQTYKVFLFHLLSHHFSTSFFLTFCPSFPLFFISVSRPLLFIISLCSAFPGLERLPWRQKQRREMNYTVRESCVCVYVCERQRQRVTAEECFCRF